MFERFTQQAREVIRRAQTEARAMGHGSVETEHELLALFGDPDSVAAEVLAEFGLTVDLAPEQVIARLGAGSGAVGSGQISFTLQAKQVCEVSLRESLALGHRHIGPEHLLLAIAGVGDGGGWQILDGLGADEKQIRSAVRRRVPPSVRKPDMPASMARRSVPSATSGATCPVCREGEPRPIDGPPEWYVLPAATRGLPDDEETRVGARWFHHQHRHPVAVEQVTEALHVSVTGVAYRAERHEYVPLPPPARPEGERSPRAFYLAVEEGTPFFGLERMEFLGKSWHVGFFRVGLDGPALCVYFDSTDAGLRINPSESSAYYDVLLASAPSHGCWRRSRRPRVRTTLAISFSAVARRPLQP